MWHRRVPAAAAAAVIAPPQPVVLTAPPPPPPAAIVAHLVAGTTGFSCFGLVKLTRLLLGRCYWYYYYLGDSTRAIVDEAAWRGPVDTTTTVAADLGFACGGEPLGALLVGGRGSSSSRSSSNSTVLDGLLRRSTGRVIMVRPDMTPLARAAGTSRHAPPGTRGWYVQT